MYRQTHATAYGVTPCIGSCQGFYTAACKRDIAEVKGTFDGAYHSTIASPLLCICQMCDSIQVCGNEEAARILAYAQASILNLIVVDVPVKPYNHGPNLNINKQGCQEVDCMVLHAQTRMQMLPIE